MDISDVLKYLRKETGLTQKELSEKTGLSLSSIISYENGLRQPNSNALTKLEAYFQVSGEYLLGKIPLDTYQINIESVVDELPAYSDVVKKFRNEFHFISFENQTLILKIEEILYSHLLEAFKDKKRNIIDSDFPNEFNEILRILRTLNNKGRKEYIKRGNELILVNDYVKEEKCNIIDIENKLST